MKKFIRIQSDDNVNVFEKLFSIDMTNPDARVADQMRITPAWTKSCIMIRKGSGYYPAVMKNWETVKDLVAKGKVTIGEETDVCDDPQAEELLKKFTSAQENYSRRAAAIKAKSASATPTQPGDIIGD